MILKNNLHHSPYSLRLAWLVDEQDCLLSSSEITHSVVNTMPGD